MPAEDASTPPLDGTRLRASENLRRVLSVLSEHGISEVIVDFAGEGDEGSIQDIAWLTPDPSGKPVAAEAFNEHAGIVLALVRRNELRDGKWTLVEDEEKTSAYDVLCDVTYDYVAATEVNWCDGEGGFGFLNIDVAKGECHLEVHQNVRESVKMFDRKFRSGDYVGPKRETPRDARKGLGR